MKNINELISFLIEANEMEISKKLNSCDDVAEVLEEYEKDLVSEDKLENLLHRSIIIKDIQYFLIDIFFYIDEKSISDKIFDLVIKYPGQFRETLLTQLGHIWLSKKQLYKLNEVLKTSEAFYKLFILLMQDNNSSTNDIKKLLTDNRKHWKAIYNYHEHLTDQISKNKIRFVDEFIGLNKEEPHV